MSSNAITTNKDLRRRVLELIRAGVPIEPACRHVGMCGGCAVQDRAYADQVAAKAAVLRAVWAAELPETLLAEIQMIASPQPYAYRTRMDYVASKDRFGLRRGGKFNYIIDLEECHLIPAAGFTAARAVYTRAIESGLPDYNLRTHEGFLRYVVVRRSPDDRFLLAVVTAADTDGTYAPALEQVAAHALAQPGVVGFHWLLNDSHADVSFGVPQRSWGAATLPMRVGVLTLQIGPNTFFQNNVYLLDALLDDVAAQMGAERPTVADLYGGVGTIALHIAGSATQVVTVESVSESASLAQQNIAANGLTNVQSVAAETLAFLRTQTPGAFRVIVADPPRTGLGPEVCAEILRLAPQRLVYVSCNTLTQRDDARLLAAGYRMTALRGYDMFPHTPHLETLAVFEKAAIRQE